MIGVGQTLGIFQAKLGLNTQDYAKGVLTANAMNKVFGESFSTFVANPLLGSIQIIRNVGAAFAGSAARQLEYAETIQRMSQATGASEQFLVALQKRLEVAGFDANRAGQAMRFFGKGILDLQRGTGPLKDIAEMIGLQVDATAPLERNLATVLDAIMSLPTAYQRSAAAAKVFGDEAGPELLNAIGGGSEAISKMLKEARQLGFAISGTANDSLAAMNTQLGYMKLAVEGIRFNAINSFLEGLNSANAGDLESILSAADRINTSVGPELRQIGRELSPLLDKAGPTLGSVAEYIADFVAGFREVQAMYEGSWLQELAEFQKRTVQAAVNQIADILVADPELTRGQRSTQRKYEQAVRGREDYFDTSPLLD